MNTDYGMDYKDIRELPYILNVKQCCEFLHIGRNKMLQLLQEGALQGFKIFGKWRREALQELIEELTWQ